ncbi:hypothetical protein TgHK011_003345 [Trichoderma gracile]|nr:hypothetical protein TgHK011_003345 [Trichoderma gracile]
MCLMPQSHASGARLASFGADEAGATAHSAPVIGRHWGGRPANVTARLGPPAGNGGALETCPGGDLQRCGHWVAGSGTAAALLELLASSTTCASKLSSLSPSSTSPQSTSHTTSIPIPSAPSRQTTSSPESIRLSPSSQQLAMRASD